MTQATLRTESDVLAAMVGEIDEYLERWIRTRGLPDALEAAVAYAVLGGGKRLRPALVLLCSEAVGGSREQALAPAAAIEFVHCFSLVHDDLPAMDDDDLRRGRPTLHVHAGEAMAILAGDALTSLAFESIAGTSLPGDDRARLVAELAGATTAMIEGQIHDTLGDLPDELPDADRLRRIHATKTGALLRAACRMGAICGGADDAVLDAITRYGAAIGLMFQIVDDLLDVTGSAEHLGKRTGKDQSAGKLTWPGVFGLDRSRSDVARLRDEALAALAPLESKTDRTATDAVSKLRDLCEEMAVRTK